MRQWTRMNGEVRERIQKVSESVEKEEVKGMQRKDEEELTGKKVEGKRRRERTGSKQCA